LSYDFWEPTPPTNSPFGRRLRMIRSSAGLTVEELARRADLDPRYYRTCESGTTPVTAAVLMRLVNALRIGPEVLFDPD
jgi:transcriptional regulator with XRE-family HTH domain